MTKLGSLQQHARGCRQKSKTVAREHADISHLHAQRVAHEFGQAVRLHHARIIIGLIRPRCANPGTAVAVAASLATLAAQLREHA